MPGTTLSVKFTEYLDEYKRVTWLIIISEFLTQLLTSYQSRES